MLQTSSGIKCKTPKNGTFYTDLKLSKHHNISICKLHSSSLMMDQLPYVRCLHWNNKDSAQNLFGQSLEIIK